MNRIIKYKRNAMIGLSTLIGTLLFNMANVYAVGFDEGAAKSLIRPWIDGVTNVILWVIPGALFFYVGKIAIKYLVSSEDERQRNNIWDKISKGVIVAIVAESIVAIIKIFGFTW